MAKLPYETATSTVEITEDFIFSSNEDNDNAFLDPWGIINNFGL